jgi:hypothetical protein
MTMPETTMDEDNSLARNEHQVRMTRNVISIEAETVSKFMSKRAHKTLGTGIS